MKSETQIGFELGIDKRNYVYLEREVFLGPFGSPRVRLFIIISYRVNTNYLTRYTEDCLAFA